MPDQQFPVVAIGASAGGLQALQALLANLAADTGVAVVLVTHMASGRESAFVEIVSRYTEMPVVTAQHDTTVEPNTVYVCPADRLLTIEDGRLKLHPRTAERPRRPIDVFMSALAEERGEAAIGVVLSGSGSDAALGIKSIKERGGLTLAQGTGDSAPQQSGMPDAAIAAGVVDLVLPVEEMGPRLADYARNYRPVELAATQDAADRDAEVVEATQAIYRILLTQVGHDFSGYKDKTFQRRVRRRMQVLQITDLGRYVSRLRADAEEVRLLFRDLLIGVTNFFRDPDAFAALEQLVIPRLFQDKAAADTLRIWVPGCATGEECYSLAILLREHLDMLRTPPRVQIFATDIDEPALALARAGRYPAAMLDVVSPARLQRFFVADDSLFTVTKEIRDMCVFSSHSVIRDPPFSRIDLISCRNLLIYLGPEFQSHVIPVFHFALRPRGFLFLGTSENVSQHADLFQPIEKKHRIFQRRDHTTAPLQFPFTPSQRAASRTSFEARAEGMASGANLRRIVEGRVMDRFAPPHVVVNQEGDILHYSPRTGKYLEPAPGLPNRQLLAMARRGLRLDLRSALREAVETRHRVVREGIAVEIDDRSQLINLTVDPFGESDHDPLFLVLFQDVGTAHAQDAARVRELHQLEGDHQAQRLEQELRDTRERLQSIIEEYETATEELKSSNEELQSINEELQSTNEELETSKEELQSVNEELNTVNAELNAKVDEADRAHTDLRNLFEGTQIATVFLDQHLVVRSFTPAVTAIFNLISTDRGRPLTDIFSHVDTGDLRRDIHSVVERGETIERKVRRLDGSAHYLMRILPYRGATNRIEGALVTFVDVTSVVEAEAHQRLLVQELNHRVRNMLQVVQALATHTLAGTSSVEEFSQAFSSRLGAMASAYGLVSRENWGEVELASLLAEQLQPFRVGDAARITIDGPPVVFAPSAALGFGLVVHELATNAVKHGALSVPDGRLRVFWEASAASPSQLVLHWCENHGPPPKKPTRKGFGTQLIEGELKQTLRAKAKFDYGPKGLEAVITVPLEPQVASLRRN